MNTRGARIAYANPRRLTGRAWTRLAVRSGSRGVAAGWMLGLAATVAPNQSDDPALRGVLVGRSNTRGAHPPELNPARAEGREDLHTLPSASSLADQKQSVQGDGPCGSIMVMLQ
jgi:hypothetical protein